MIDFADWLRLALLWKHGGVWLDATLLLTAPLDFLVNDTDAWRKYRNPNAPCMGYSTRFQFEL